MAKKFQSIYKTVGGGEGLKCKYPTRLDTYGCGCQHDCAYCYAKSLLYFRKQWHAKDPYFRQKYNPNKEDCCNLRITK